MSRSFKSKDKRKPPKWYKKMKKKVRKAKVKQALVTGKEEVPAFKKSDEWNWS